MEVGRIENASNDKKYGRQKSFNDGTQIRTSSFIDGRAVAVFFLFVGTERCGSDEKVQRSGNTIRYLVQYIIVSRGKDFDAEISMFRPRSHFWGRGYR